MGSYWRHPDINPVLIPLWGPLQIRWYSLLFVGGFLVGRALLVRLSREDRFQITKADAERLIVRLLLGAVIGARVFYCLIYDPSNFFSNPFYLFEVYKGGLSFHGALIGIVLTSLHYAEKHHIPFWNLADALALATPTGLAMGRIGNFLNGELYGRVSYVPWAMIFRDGGPEPRHPSQIYELLLEGVLLFAVLWLMKPRLKKDGQIATLFLVGYSLCRFTAEFFREPDAQVGYLLLGLSMGQWLSVIMFLLSTATAWFIWVRMSVKRAR